MKYKVGDRVEVVTYNRPATITGFSGDNLWYKVKFDDQQNEFYVKEVEVREYKDHPPYLDRPKADHKEHDAVNHPEWYTSDPSGVECIEITKHRDFCVGNAIKYLWRCGLKKDADKSIKEKEIEDLKKAIWYINTKIDMLTNE